MENQCKRFAELADAVVISVDYPLSPEVKYPVAFHMCCETVRWVWENARGMLGVDRRRSGFPEIVPGGTMAVTVTLLGQTGRDWLVFPMQALSTRLSCGTGYE